MGVGLVPPLGGIPEFYKPFRLLEFESYPHNILPYFVRLYYNVIVFTEYTLCVLCSRIIFVFIHDFVEKILKENRWKGH